MYLQRATTAEANDLLNRIKPALAEGTLEEAFATVRKTWPLEKLLNLLTHPNTDVRKVVALTLGAVGDRRAVQPLAVALHDEDPMVTQMAEHALWTLWFRLGQCPAIALLKAGSCHLNHGNYDIAVEKFTQAIDRDPDFAEAYNQRAIAHYLAERYEASIHDCQAALAKMPQHFGAMAGMGHSHAHLRQWTQARHCYRLALAIHPRLEGITSALQQVEAIIK